MRGLSWLALGLSVVAPSTTLCAATVTAPVVTLDAGGSRQSVDSGTIAGTIIVYSHLSSFASVESSSESGFLGQVVNSTPQMSISTQYVTPGTATTTTVSAVATDVDNDVLSIEVLNSGSSGLLTVTTTGSSLTLSAAVGTSVVDVISLRVTDGLDASAVVDVSVNADATTFSIATAVVSGTVINGHNFNVILTPSTALTHEGSDGNASTQEWQGTIALPAIDAGASQYIVQVQDRDRAATVQRTMTVTVSTIPLGGN